MKKNISMAEEELVQLIQTVVQKVFSEQEKTTGKRYYLLSYDRKLNSNDPKDDIEALINNCKARIVVYPNESTIIFLSTLSLDIILKEFSNSETMKPLSYTLYPMGKDMKSGIINRPKQVIDKDLFRQDYKQ